MNAELAQRIALVSHGNAVLAGLADQPNLLIRNSAFQYVGSVTFRTSERSIHSIDLWYESLRERGAEGLSLREDGLVVHADDLLDAWMQSSVLISEEFEERRQRILESFGETGQWDDEEQVATSAILESTDRPWKLSFRHEALPVRPSGGLSLPAAKAELLDAVAEAREFAAAHEMGWADAFEKALALAHAERPVAPFHPDLLPDAGYPLDARQVIAAAAQAWVFGAWGWGDRFFESESVASEFERCDARLRASVIAALVAATNSFDGSQRGRAAV